MDTKRIDPQINNFPVIETLEPKKVQHKLSFEEMKRSLGKVMLLHQKLKRKHHDLMVQILDADHKKASEQHADSYRSTIAICMTAAKVAIEGCAVLSVASPQIFMKGGEFLSNHGIDLIGRFGGDVNKLSDASNKLFSSLGSMTESGKQLVETRQAGDRTEISSAESRFKSFLDRRHQDLIQTQRDETEELRKVEEILKRESEVISLMNR